MGHERGSPDGTLDAMTRLPSLGPRGEGWLALQGICFALVAAGWLSVPAAPSGVVGLALGVAGLAVALAGAALLMWGIAELRRGNALAAAPYPRTEATLVGSGPYAVVRHPIYAGLLLIAVGLAIDHPWIGSAIAAALLGLVLDLKRRREEAWLMERFPGYREYRRGVKALIPFIY